VAASNIVSPFSEKMPLRGRLSASGAGSVVATSCWALLVLVFLGILSCCHAYFVGNQIQIQPRSSTNFQNNKDLGPFIARHKLPSRQFSRRFHTSLSSSGDLETEISSLCDADRFEKAIEILERESLGAHTKSCYATILKNLADREEQLEEQRIEEKSSVISKPPSDKDTVRYLQSSRILDRLLELGKLDSELLPTADDFNCVIKMWGSSDYVEEASIKCRSYLRTLWSLHNKEQEQKFVPLKESYFYAIRACSQRDRGSDAAKRAENLMNEMESAGRDHPDLLPDRSIANEVMNAWGKSGQRFEQGKRSQKVLEKMIEIALAEDGGGHIMAPDTNSFNIVLNALAQGRERNSEIRAEDLLQRMELVNRNAGKSGKTPIDCRPDETSFNTVLNGWASSRHRGAADRAIDILEHMKKRHEAGLTEVHPDESTYNTVLKALAKSRDPSSIDRAEAVFDEYLEGCESGGLNLSHNAFTYNSMINCYAKSKHPEAGKRSLELFETMKANRGKPGWEFCFVDVFTYTSLIDAISKQQSYDASEQAISLLQEFEKSFEETQDMRFRPNIRLYTSTVNAIGRSHKSPDRARDIVDRVESSYIEGLTHWEGKPDVVFYNALINAYGWSDMEGRSQKSFDILKHMVSLFESGTLDDAKPDTVSFNSVLNACAHERTKGQTKSDSIMKIVVEAFDLLNSATEYGNPDQNTYVQVLICIANHMAKNDEKRATMAEATFLQCAAKGLVSPNIISKLHAAIPNALFQKIMGPASSGGRVLRFDISKLPQDWTDNVYAPGSRSRRRQKNFQVTKNVISNSMRKGNNRNKNVNS